MHWLYHFHCRNRIEGLCKIVQSSVVNYLRQGAEVMRPHRFVCLSFCLSVCLQDYCKSNQPISLKLGVMISLLLLIRIGGTG